MHRRIVKKYGEVLMYDFNNHIFIKDFFVKPEFIGQGHGKKLISYFPEKCWLNAWPTRPSSGGLNNKQLIKFYRKNGFKFYWCENRMCYFGFRGFRPSKKFWDGI